MRLLVRDGDELIDTKVVESKPVSIGSDEKCEIRLPDRRIMPTQAVLSPCEDGSWVIQGCGDGPPLLVNGRTITGPTPIHHADEIGIADYVIAVYQSSEEQVVGPSPPPPAVSKEVSEIRAHPLPAGAFTKSTADGLSLREATPERIARFSLGLKQCSDIPKLIDYVLDATLREFAGRVAYVATRRNGYGPLEFVQGRNMEGRSVGEPPSLDDYRYRCLERGHFVCVPQTPTPEVESAIVVPLSCDRGQLGLVYVDRKKGAPPFNGHDLDLLIVLAAITASHLESIVLNQLEVQEVISAGQLSFVREVQTQMDPTNVPQWHGLQLAVYCKPGDQRGGDIYDVMRLPNGFAAILVANVSGEGTRAVLAMAEIRAAFRIAGLHGDAPHVFFRAANWMLCTDRQKTQMQGAAVIMNPQTGEFAHSTAAHIGAVVVTNRGEMRSLAAGETPAVGSVPNHAYEAQLDRLDHGETLALFTAGCSTVCDADGNALGWERFTESIKDGFGQTAGVALDELIQDHSAFFKHGNQPDDITILLFHRVARSG